jgi:hypothetical protein
MPIDSFRLRRAVAVGLMSLVLTAAPRSGFAQTSDPRSAARAQFERGMTFVKSGDLEAAAEAFDLAYRTSPHYSVLYNLGLAYGTLGRPVEAALTLERFLSEGGERISGPRRKEVTKLIAQHRSRIGQVELEVLPEGAAIAIDGRDVGTAPIAEPLFLAKGTHALVASKAGFRSRAISLEVAGGEATRTRLELEAELTARPRPAALSITCKVPAATLSIDGEVKGSTPLTTPLLVEPGRHTLAFSRAGFRTHEESVVLDAGGSTLVDCHLRPDPALLRTDGAWLEVQSHPNAMVFVNDERYHGERLAPGRHTVRVECNGFRTWTGTVFLAKLARRHLAVTLKPTREHLAELDAERQKRNILAAGIGALGLGLIGGASALYVWNDGRYDDWASSREAARRDLATGGAGPGSVAQWDELTTQAASLERTDNLALGLGLAGVVGLATAGLVWLGGD